GPPARADPSSKPASSSAVREKTLSAGTTHTLTAEGRRPNTCRAFSRACSASKPCTLPTAWCGLPGASCLKTSQRTSRLHGRGLAGAVLPGGVGGQGLAHPGAVGVGLVARGQALGVAGAVALHHAPELV